jgi:hypothetical protein
MVQVLVMGVEYRISLQYYHTFYNFQDTGDWGDCLLGCVAGLQRRTATLLTKRPACLYNNLGDGWCGKSAIGAASRHTSASLAENSGTRFRARSCWTTPFFLNAKVGTTSCAVDSLPQLKDITH